MSLKGYVNDAQLSIKTPVQQWRHGFSHPFMDQEETKLDFHIKGVVLDSHSLQDVSEFRVAAITAVDCILRGEYTGLEASNKMLKDENKVLSEKVIELANELQALKDAVKEQHEAGRAFGHSTSKLKKMAGIRFVGGSR